jgi:hypothetical protein
MTETPAVEGVQTGDFSAENGKYSWIRITLTNMTPAEMENFFRYAQKWCEKPDSTNKDMLNEAVKATETAEVYSSMRKEICSKLKTAQTKTEVKKEILTSKDVPGSKIYQIFHSTWTKMMNDGTIVPEENQLLLSINYKDIKWKVKPCQGQ